MKKILSLILAICLLIPNGMVSFASESTTTSLAAPEYYYFNDFEKNSTDGIAMNLKGGTTATIVTEADGNDYLKTVTQDDTSSYSHDIYTYNWIGDAVCPSRHMVLSFDLKTPTNPQQFSVCVLGWTDDTHQTATNAYTLLYVNGGGQWRLQGREAYGGTVATDSWTHFDFVMNIDTHKLDMYVDDELVEDDYDYEKMNGYHFSSLRQLRFYGHTNNVAPAKDMWLDNIAIYEGTVPYKPAMDSHPAPAAVSYTRTSSQAGFGGGTVSITAPEGDVLPTSYNVAWGNENGMLSDYKPFPAVTASTTSSVTTYVIEEGVLIPPEATDLYVYANYATGTSDSISTKITGNLLTLAEEKYNFYTASDIHVGTSLSQYLKNGLDFFVNNQNDVTLGVFSVGDVANGFEAEWQNFQNIKNTYFTGKLQWYGTLGNHEFVDEGPNGEQVAGDNVDPANLELANKYGASIPDFYYYNIIDGKYFIHLYPYYETEAQTQWLDQLLDEAYAKGVEAYVFDHFPFENTVTGTISGILPYEGGAKGEILTEMYNVINSHPNVVAFYGHTHYGYEHTNIGKWGMGREASHFNAGCMSYYNNYQTKGHGMYLKGYDDYDIIYAMDYFESKKVPNGTYIVPKAEYKAVTNSIAYVSDIKIDGTTVADFDKDTTSYFVTLEDGASVPVVTATALSENASVDVSDVTMPANGVAGSVTVTCTAADGETTKEYVVKFGYKHEVYDVVSPDSIEVVDMLRLADNKGYYTGYGSDSVGGDATKFYFDSTNTSPLFDGATALRRTNDIPDTYNSVFYSNGGNPGAYDGTDGYWAEAVLGSDATVYVGIKEADLGFTGVWQPGIDAGYTLVTDGTKLAGTSVVYKKSFKAGEKVQIPSFGAHSSIVSGSGAQIETPSVHMVVWDDVPLKVKGLMYNGVPVHGFDQSKTAYSVVLHKAQDITITGDLGSGTSLSVDKSGYNAQTGTGSIAISAANELGMKQDYTISFTVNSTPYTVINGYNAYNANVENSVLTYGTSHTTKMYITEGLATGSYKYINRQYSGQPTLTVDNSILGATAVRFLKNGGAFAFPSGIYWSKNYCGEDGKYFSAFELTSPATVIASTHATWPAAPEGWTKLATPLVTGENYARHFEAGEAVLLPAWGNDTAVYDPGVGYWIVWDDIKSADLASLTYSIDGGEAVAVEGFDKDKTEYVIDAGKDVNVASISGAAVYNRNNSAWAAGGDCAKVTYSSQSLDLVNGSNVITATVTSRNGDVTKTYTVTFNVEKTQPEAVKVKGLMYNGVPVHNFSEDVASYNVVLAKPQEIVITGDLGSETTLNTDASGYDAATGTGSVVVTASNSVGATKTYTINFSVDTTPYKVINGWNAVDGALSYSTATNKIVITEGLKTGSYMFQDRQYSGQVTFTIDNSIVGATAMRFMKNNGVFNTTNGAYWTDTYSGSDGKYFTAFELTSPATVIVGIHVIANQTTTWPLVPEGWTELSAPLVMNKWSQGKNYARHFEAGEAVLIPSYGNTDAPQLDSGAGYWIVWDDIKSADLASLTYTLDNGEAVAVEGFDKDKTEYVIDIGKDVKVASISGAAVYNRNNSAWAVGEDCAKVAYSAESVDLSDGSKSITATVTSRNGDATKAYTVTFKKPKSNDNTLKSLAYGEVELDLTNGDDTFTVEYEAGAKLVAIANDAKAEVSTVEITGVGEYVVTVTAENGEVKEYTINVIYPQVKLSVSANGGSVVNAEGNIVDGTKSYNEKTALVLTAEAAEGFKFAYWIDEVSGRIVSEEAVLELTLVSDKVLSAVFTNNSTKTIIFKNKNGQISKRAEIGEGDTVEVPTNPYYMGYNFAGWKLNGVLTEYVAGGEIEYAELGDASEIVFDAYYTKKVDLYKAQVTGGTIAPEAADGYIYDTKLTVTASAAETGKKFSHWIKDSVDANKNIVSYDESYSFYIGAADTTVTAIFVEEDVEVAKAPVIVMTEPVVLSGQGRIAFFAERNLYADEENGRELIETGILVNLDKEDFEMGKDGTLKATSTSKAGKGQFTVRKANLDEGDTVYAKAYMVYSENGEIKTIFSNVVTGEYTVVTE